MSAPSKESRAIDRLQWLIIYQGMRRARSHAVNWINRSAKTPKGSIAAPRRLGRHIMHVFHEDADYTIAAIRECGVVMQFTLHGSQHVYALKILPETTPQSHDVSWGLACLAGLVAKDAAGNDPAASFHRNTQPLFRAFGHGGWHMLHHMIADTLCDAWREVYPDFDHDLVRERLARFKKAKATSAQNQPSVAFGGLPRTSRSARSRSQEAIA